MSNRYALSVSDKNILAGGHYYVQIYGWCSVIPAERNILGLSPCPDGTHQSVSLLRYLNYKKADENNSMPNICPIWMGLAKHLL